MAAVDVGPLGSGINTTSGTTLAVTASTTIPAGTLLVLALTCDNYASTSAPTLALSASGGGTWTQRGTTTGSGVTTTAGTGIWAATFTTLTTSVISSGATITTITFGSAVVAKAAAVRGFSGVQNVLRGSVASGTSTSGAPTVTTTGTALVNGDLVIATIHGETNVVPTGDSDVLNGTWTAISGANTATGAAGLNTTVGIQGKVVTATGAQLYNATTLLDSVAFAYGLVPVPEPSMTQVAYQFYAEGTEAGSAALAAQDTAITSNITAGDVNLQLRTLMQVTANAGFYTDDYRLEYEWNGSGAWWPCVTGDVISDGVTWESPGQGFLPINTAYKGGGQSFMGSGTPLKSVQLRLMKVSTPTGTISVQIFAHTGTFGSGTGTGPALATATNTLSIATLTSVDTWYTFNFDGSFTPELNTPYVVAIVSDTLGTASAYVKMTYTTTDVHPGGRSSISSTDVWGGGSSYDHAFWMYSVSPALVLFYVSADLTDGAATTNRLTGGTGSFIAGEVSESGTASDLLITASNYTELLYSITLKKNVLANGDTLRFRVVRNATTTGMTYTQTPTIGIVVDITPVASFTTDKTAITAGEQVRFTDTSSNNPTSWLWDFGAGASPATASTQGPHVVTYSTAGTSTATLTAGNAAGSDASDPTNIAVAAPPVVPTWVGSAGSYTTAGGTINITLPSGWQPGDLAILVGSVDTATDPPFAPPGWTFQKKTAATNMFSYIWTRVLQAGDTFSYVVDRSSSFGMGVWRDAVLGTVGTFGIRSGTSFTAIAPDIAATGYRAHIWADRSAAASAAEADVLQTQTYGTARGFYPGNLTIAASVGAGAVYFGDSPPGQSGANTATLKDSSTNAWGIQIDLGGTAPVGTGRPTVRVDSSTWAQKPALVYMGSGPGWVEKPWNVWDGSQWKKVT